MRVNDWARKIMLAAGLSLGIPSGANADFNIFNPNTWGEYKPGDIFNQLNQQNTSRVDTSTLYTEKNEIIKKAKAEWEKRIAEIEQAGGGDQKIKPQLADSKKVDYAISNLYQTVDTRVLNIVLPAWELSSTTKASLEAVYGTGLSEAQYKKLLFWDEYQYAKIKANEICKQLHIQYNEVDVNTFAVAYASIATLGYGIGRPNMEIAVNSAVLKMQNNVDSAQWTLPLVMQWLPEGITTPQGLYVNLNYLKIILYQIYQLYGMNYYDYGSQPAQIATTPLQQATPLPPPAQQQPQQPQTQEGIQAKAPESTNVNRAISSINNAIEVLNSSKNAEYEKKIKYFDSIIDYGEMLYVIKTKSSTIDVILLEASGAGLITYYCELNSGIWRASLTPSAEKVLRESYSYSNKKIDFLNRELQKMANNRNDGADKVNEDVVGALEKAGKYLVPYGNNLADLGTDALRSQISNYQSLQTRNRGEIDSQYNPQINYLNELSELVYQYGKETEPSKKDSILEKIGELEQNGVVKLDPPIYKILTGKEYTPKPKEEQVPQVPSADEILNEQNVPEYTGSGSRYVQIAKTTADSVRNMTIQPSNLDYNITVYAYLGTLTVEEHTVYDSSGVRYTATVLTEEEKNAVLEKIADKLNKGKLLDEKTIKEAVKEATGLSTSMKNGELQNWKTAFGNKRGWRCDGTQKRRPYGQNA